MRPVGNRGVSRTETTAVGRNVTHHCGRDRRAVDEKLYAGDGTGDPREKADYQIQSQQHFEKRQREGQRADDGRRQQPKAGHRGRQIGRVPDLQNACRQQQAADEEAEYEHDGGHGASRCAGLSATTSFRAPASRSAYNGRVRSPNVILLSAFLAACAAYGPTAPDFTLTDDSGRAWALSAQRGKPVLLIFGFSHCRDTCPTTIAKLADLTHKLGLSGGNVEIVMVSVDPARDTPPVLHRFVRQFDGPVVGLTGSKQHVARVEEAYHVWAQRIPGSRGKNYDVAHSAVVYFITASGQIHAIRDDSDSETALAAEARSL